MTNQTFLSIVNKYGFFEFEETACHFYMMTKTRLGIQKTVILKKDGTPFFEQFKDAVKRYDVDGDIDQYRDVDKSIGIRDLLVDFENYACLLNKHVKVLEIKNK